MRTLELFAGAGGAALGLEAAGLEHAALVELNADACATLRAADLGPVFEGDVRDLDGIAAMAGDVDLIWSSFPCQAWSQAGSRKGAMDDRNGWPWTVDAIDRFKPTWFLGENVKGLIQHRTGCTARGGQRMLFGARPELECPGCYMERVIMPDLKKRFAHAGYWLLDAADYGVPQHRRRVILWAGPKPLAKPKQTHGPGAAMPWVSMASALGLSRDQYVVGGGTNPSKPGEDNRRYRDLTHEPSTTVAATQVSNAGPWVVAAGQTGEGRPRSVEKSAPTIGTKGTAYFLASNDYWARPAPTVVASEVKGTRARPATNFTFNGGPDRASDALAVLTGYADPGPTVTVADGQGLGSMAAREFVEKRLGRRRLTVKECAILQDFPEGHPFQGTKTEHYRQVGNAVPPTLAQVVAEQLLAAE